MEKLKTDVPPSNLNHNNLFCKKHLGTFFISRCTKARYQLCPYLPKEPYLWFHQNTVAKSIKYKWMSYFSFFMTKHIEGCCCTLTKFEKAQGFKCIFDCTTKTNKKKNYSTIHRTHVENLHVVAVWLSITSVIFLIAFSISGLWNTKMQKRTRFIQSIKPKRNPFHCVSLLSITYTKTNCWPRWLKSWKQEGQKSEIKKQIQINC